MTKGEKRNFKLFASKTGGISKIYIQLFDHLNKYEVYDEALILKKIPEIKKAQLSNIKANLYKQLLRSIRDFNKESYAEIKAREKFDFAKVLYAKGQYKASLSMINQVKSITEKIQRKPLLYLALAFEKQIEGQHVTGSMADRALEITQHSKEIVDNLKLSDQLSNLSLTLYGIHLQRGLVKTEEDIEYLNGFIKKYIPDQLDEYSMDFYQRLYLYQSYVWYYHMLQDFDHYYIYANKWVSLFSDYPAMLKPETTLYIKGLHNVLNSLFTAGRVSKFNFAFNQLLNFKENHQLRLSRNEEFQLAIVTYTHGINQIFLSTKYQEGVEFVRSFESILENKTYPWDLNRKLVFYYKIACVYYGANELKSCIKYLNKITNKQYPNFKEDIQCFARILNLIAHYDLGNDQLVSYQVRSVYRYLAKSKELQAVQKEIFKFVKRTPSINPKDVKEEFIGLKTRLLPFRKDKIERRPFIYLDIISYLDSKIKGVTMVEAIRQRRRIPLNS